MTYPEKHIKIYCNQSIKKIPLSVGGTQKDLSLYFFGGFNF